MKKSVCRPLSLTNSIWISPARCPRRMQSSISSQKTPKYKKLGRKEKQPRIFRFQAASLCRWWGSNPHVLLAQGILSFYPHLPSGVIQWYLVISGSHCAKAKFTPQRTIIWNIHDFSMRFSSTLFFRFGPPKWKLEGCSGGMQGKTLLCLGTKRKENQG